MGWPKLLVFVRHAESEGNIRTVDERATFEVATNNYAITERGQAQARITGEYLRTEFPTFDVRYSSYYRRAKETMELLCPGEKYYEEDMLAEAQRGIWHSMTAQEIDRLYPGEPIRKQREGLYHYRPWGGENWPDVIMRIRMFFMTLNRDYENENVLVVCHGHWLILAQKLIQHFTIDEALERYRSRVAENASVTVYRGTKNMRGKSRLELVLDNAVPWRDKL